MCIIYSEVRQDLNGLLVDEQTEQKILTTTDYKTIKKAVDRINDGVKICNKLRTRANLLHLLIHENCKSLLEFFSIQDIYNFCVEHRITEQTELIKVLNGLDNILSEITGYNYNYIDFMVQYSWIIYNYEQEFIELYYYLQESSTPLEIQNMILDIMDTKEFVFCDGCNYWALTRDEANDTAKSEFEYLELEDIYNIYLEY